jgi:hypothetical protein
VSLGIASPPQLLYYARGQEFSAEGLIVEGTFDDETARELTPDEYELIQPDMNGTGPRIATVRAGELSASFPILINNSDSVLGSITVTAPEGGLIQYLGESLNTGAIEVTGTFTGPNGDETKTLTAFSTSGYDRATRGKQTVTVSVNGKTGTFPVTVKVPANAEISTAVVGTDPNPKKGHDTAFIKGQTLQMAQAKIRAAVTANGTTALLYGGDGIEFDEIKNYDPAAPGRQTLTLDLDDASASLPVYVADIEPEIYFDHGFMRTAEDPTGRGRVETMPGAGYRTLGDGAYHTTLQSPPLVLSPVRVLIGYDADHTDLGASYAWTVTPDTGCTVSGPNGEFLTLSPQAAGTWTVSVEVTGRNYVDGSTITRSAETRVICDPLPSTYAIPNLNLRNFSPGQFTETGTGYGWSLGTIGGYQANSVQHSTSYTVGGNGFGTWREPGVIWFQEDRNGNGLPDEIWYEVNAGRGPWITRRYSIKFFKSGDGTQINEYGQTIRDIYWVDAKGRTGQINGGWPKDWGVSNEDGAWVIYTATLMGDKGVIKSDSYNLTDFAGPGGTIGGPFADHVSSTVSIDRAVDAAGNPVTLTNVRFVKVHTGLFQYGGIFGEVSAEISSADFLGGQTNFPLS